MLHVPSSSKVCIEMYVSMPAYDIYAYTEGIRISEGIHAYTHSYICTLYICSIPSVHLVVPSKAYVCSANVAFFFFFLFFNYF